ncbi:MAG: ABC transporter ATP-binding protein [Chloroflexi bacterium]|nr:ABC transporter ATP-binding protein [Chloroflexota bacterium]
MAAVLALESVSVDYGGAPVVDGVSLSLSPGRVVGLLGPNGAGKSTLLRLAAGLLAPRAGRVCLDGRPLAALSRAAVARRIAVVPQGGQAPAAFTGWEVALMGRTPHLGWFGHEGPADIAATRRALTLADALPLAERRVSDLSGGERQRLLLARALAQEPAVLLLDEPTVHLDLAHQMALLDLIGQLARGADLAAMAVFHDLNLAAAACDEVVVLAGGRIQAAGPPAAVLTSDLLRRVFGLALQVTTHPTSGQPVVLLPDISAARGVAPPTPFTELSH